MLEFTDSERALFTEMRAITTDANGNEVLVGLTAEETAFYLEHSRRFLAKKRDHEGTPRYLELRDKHERARLEVLGAEIALRRYNPPCH